MSFNSFSISLLLSAIYRLKRKNNKIFKTNHKYFYKLINFITVFYIRFKHSNPFIGSQGIKLSSIT